MIKRSVVFTVLACSTAALPQPAGACPVAQHGFDSRRFAADAIVRATLSRREGDAATPIYTFDAVEVIEGMVSQRSFIVKSADHVVCMSIPSDIEIGSEVILYLRKAAESGWSVTGWDSNPFSTKALRAKSAVARKWSSRRSRYFQLDTLSNAYLPEQEPGALAFNDPKLWFKPEDIAPILFRSPSSVVTIDFMIDDAGSIINCQATTRVDEVDDLDERERLCDLLRARAKMVPPVFPEERRGRLFLSPRGAEVQ
jgi:hypothetical protein